MPGCFQECWYMTPQSLPPFLDNNHEALPELSKLAPALCKYGLVHRIIPAVRLVLGPYTVQPQSQECA